MLTLYFSPGACSLASHIAIEETGAPYEAKLTALARGEQRTPEYLAINPRARVPALKTEDGVITENVAILTYLAKRFPEKNLLPRDLPGEVRCISTMAWLSNTVHPGFTRVFRPERFAEDAATHEAIKKSGRRCLLGEPSGSRRASRGEGVDDGPPVYGVRPLRPCVLPMGQAHRAPGLRPQKLHQLEGTHADAPSGAENSRT
jgi:glutathione S-transferase